MQPAPGSRRWKWNGTAKPSASSLRVVVVSCGAVNSAALLLRSASDKHPNGLGEFVGARRPPLHGAPRDHDAGVSSVSKKRHGFPEDRRHQRFLFSRAAHALSARADSIAGPHARRDGTDRGTAGAAVVRTNGGLRAVSTGWRCRKIFPTRVIASSLDSKGRIQLLYRPNNV